MIVTSTEWLVSMKDKSYSNIMQLTAHVYPLISILLFLKQQLLWGKIKRLYGYWWVMLVACDIQVKLDDLVVPSGIKLYDSLI